MTVQPPGDKPLGLSLALGCGFVVLVTLMAYAGFAKHGAAWAALAVLVAGIMVANRLSGVLALRRTYARVERWGALAAEVAAVPLDTAKAQVHALLLNGTLGATPASGRFSARLSGLPPLVQDLFTRYDLLRTDAVFAGSNLQPDTAALPEGYRLVALDFIADPAGLPLAIYADEEPLYRADRITPDRAHVAFPTLYHLLLAAGQLALHGE